MNINEKLDNILYKHGMIKHTDYKEFENMISVDLCKNQNIGLYGVGAEVMPLLHMLSKIKDFSIKKCFDKSKKEFSFKNLIKDTNVAKIEDVNSFGIEIILVASKDYSSEMINILKKLDYHGEIVDVFSLLDGYIQDHFVDYRTVSKDRMKYQKTKSEKDLKKLIKDYILIKDFINTIKYIDIYIDSEFADAANYISLKKEITDLLDHIKGQINKRQTQDIVINWVDALSFYDIPKFDFLNEHAKKSYMFNNAYTVMPWTTETLKTVTFGEYPIEGLLFAKNIFNKDNNKLLGLLNKSDYKFAYCGLPRMSRFFTEDVYTPMEIYDIKFSSSLPSQWNALALLCGDDRPLCLLIHTLHETHEPFISGECDSVRWFGSTLKDWDNPDCRNQASVASRYIDEQLRFYESFYGKNVTEIYMSDHGRVGNSPMDENKTHIMLFVHGKKIKPCVQEKTFSLVNISDLVEKIIYRDDDWDNLFRDYVLIENLDAYDSVIVDDVLSGRLNREEMCQCSVIVTKTGKYFLYADGREDYYPERNAKKNEINNSAYFHEIEQLRQKCGKEFIDIYKYDKFKYSRLLYEKS